jgi:putative membrane protein
MKRQLSVFFVRWILNSFGIWIAVRLLGTAHFMNGDQSTNSIGIFLLAGLVFSVINTILKPIFTIISLPIILLTLGLFTVIVNGLLVYISLRFIPQLSMTFSSSILAGIILSLVNYIVSAALELKKIGRSAGGVK